MQFSKVYMYPGLCGHTPPGKARDMAPAHCMHPKENRKSLLQTHQEGNEGPEHCRLDAEPWLQYLALSMPIQAWLLQSVHDADEPAANW